MNARLLGSSIALITALASLFLMACGHGYYTRNDAFFGTTSGKLTGAGFVAGSGTISSTTTVGGYPVSGVSVGPGGTTVYGSPYGGAPYGTPYGYGAPYGTPYGSPYGAPYGTPYGYGPAYGGYGTYSSCTGAVACGSSVTVERSGVTVTVP